jgi:hypothetical protein
MFRTGTGYKHVKTLVNSAAEAVSDTEYMAYVADVSCGCVSHSIRLSPVVCSNSGRLGQLFRYGTAVPYCMTAAPCRWTDVSKGSLVRAMELCAKAKVRPMLILNKVDLLARKR